MLGCEAGGSCEVGGCDVKQEGVVKWEGVL